MRYQCLYCMYTNMQNVFEKNQIKKIYIEQWSSLQTNNNLIKQLRICILKLYIDTVQMEFHSTPSV